MIKSGIILVDKPIGVSSQYVVTGVKWAFKCNKAGHTGTLDVMASGLLPVCLGEATKFSQYMLNRDKSYIATLKLGQATTTGDQEGEVIATAPSCHIAESVIVKTLSQFVGRISQVPPMYSALKHQGQPLYQLARAGKEIERKPREVEIFSLELMAFCPPFVTCMVTCSKGTYVRTLFEDVAKEMGTVCFLSALRRDGISGLPDAPWADFYDLKAGPEFFESQILPTDSVLQQFRGYTLEDVEYDRLSKGLQVSADVPDGMLRLYAGKQQFIGLGSVLNQKLKVARLLSQQARDNLLLASQE